MKNLSFFCLLVLLSCNSNDAKFADKIKTDTITIVETRIDTVYLPKPNIVEDDSVQLALQKEFYVYERLPNWLFSENVMNRKLFFTEAYSFDNRMNPLYLEGDFDSDGLIDVAFPISKSKSDKKGFAIIHRKDFSIHIIGAGNNIKEGFSDDLAYSDIWNISREEKLVSSDVENPENSKTYFPKGNSLKIEMSEIGGGTFFWNGKEYVYVHQTC
ncbi:MAG: hypothetical protein ACI85I_001025 [Arenicella sp.]|jgi:hypothetical protein